MDLFGSDKAYSFPLHASSVTFSWGTIEIHLIHLKTLNNSPWHFESIADYFIDMESVYSQWKIIYFYVVNVLFQGKNK